jgi:threonine synthase
MGGSYFSGLRCALCEKAYSGAALMNLCPACERPLFAEYDLARAKGEVDRDSLAARVGSMWRYEEFLPLMDPGNRVTLGEGWTPLLEAPRLGAQIGLKRLYIKEESVNPTGSFKARGMSAAISRAKELGVTRVAIPSAGNAGGAASAYAARAGMEAWVFMPKDTPEAFFKECEMSGAHVERVDGLISDCGKIVAARKEAEGWFDLSTLKEPFRVEGKKTMGYELAEQMDWELPDVILYPTGGGTGLIGMWKAFDEMEQLEWIGPHRPRMISVQAAGCAPMVNAFNSGAEFAEPIANAQTDAFGLRVPGAVGDFLILRAVRESGGTAVAVEEAAIFDGASTLGKTEGIFAAPESGAVVAALRILVGEGVIGKDERTVLFDTGSGAKYAEVYANRG